jgi:hypothetical protein
MNSSVTRLVGNHFACLNTMVPQVEGYPYQGSRTVPSGPWPFVDSSIWCKLAGGVVYVVNKVGHTVNQRRVSNQMTRDLFPFPVSTFGGRSSPFGKHQYPEMLGMQYSFSSNVGKLHCLLTHTKECCQGLQKKIEAQSTNQYYLRARSEHCSWLYSWHDCRRLVDSTTPVTFRRTCQGQYFCGQHYCMALQICALVEIRVFWRSATYW